MGAGVELDAGRELVLATVVARVQETGRTLHLTRGRAAAAHAGYRRACAATLAAGLLALAGAALLFVDRGAGATLVTLGLGSTAALTLLTPRLQRLASRSRAEALAATLLLRRLDLARQLAGGR